MGIFNNANDLLNRETAKMGKAVKSASLNSQLKELRKQRTAAMARLGEAIYPRIKGDIAFRETSAALFDCIDDIDRQIKGFEYDIAALERHDVLTSPGIACLKCGYPISEGDQFCLKCGNKIENAVSENDAKGHCPRCGTKTEPEHAFCMRCGAKITF